jgi:hypothetical protein
MAYSFKVYISDGKEYFEYDNGQKTTKKSFVFSQSLMDLLYLDIWFYGDLFEKMGKSVRSLYSSRDSQWSDETKKGLDILARQHIYFEFLRLDWMDRLKKAEEQEFQEIVDLLPYKKLTHIPSNIGTMQDQLLDLWRDVLDILSPDKPIQKKMVDYYNEKGRDKLNTFQFQPQPMSFEVIDKKTFTEVLYQRTFTISLTTSYGNASNGNNASVSVKTAGNSLP